jgi:hypothetical protein
MAIVRLKGRVRGAASGAIVVRRAELVAEGGERETSRDGDTLDLVLDDGTSVRVAIDDETRVAPQRVQSGRWSELESSEDAAAFRRRAPAPHVRVKRLASTSVRDGDRVELVGVPTEEIDVVGEAGGYRSASGKRIVAVRARHLAVGDDATRELDRSLAPEEGWLRLIFGAVFGGIFTGIAWLVETVVEQLQWVATGLCIVGLVVSVFVPPMVAVYLSSACLGGLGFIAFLAHKRHEPPHFTTGNEHAASYFFWWGIFMPPVYAGLPLIVFLWLLIDPLVNAISSRRTARRMRVLVTTPRFAKDRADGAWGSTVGTVVEGKGDGKSELVLDTDAGRATLVEARAPWSTSPRGGGSRGEIGAGWRVLLVGRIERAGEAIAFRYSGPDSLMYFATPAEIDPESAARSYLARRRNTYAFMVVLALLVLGATLWFLAKMPPSPSK